MQTSLKTQINSLHNLRVEFRAAAKEFLLSTNISIISFD